MTLKLDYSNMMISPGGIAADAWRGAGPQFKNAKTGFEKLTSSGEVGFVGLPGDPGLIQQVTHFADSARDKYDDVVILGIGGSALGPIALRTALRPTGWNMLDDRARGGFPRLQVLGNGDPETIAALLGRLKFERTRCLVAFEYSGAAVT